MRNCVHLLCLLLAGLQLGCILPTPSGATLAPPIEGKVVASSGTPIGNVSLVRTIEEYPNDYSHQTTSEADGTFAFPAMYVRHRYYVFGIALNHPVPNTNLMFGSDKVAATIAGYRTERISSGSVGRGEGTTQARRILIKMKKL